MISIAPRPHLNQFSLIKRRNRNWFRHGVAAVLALIAASTVSEADGLEQKTPAAISYQVPRRTEAMSIDANWDKPYWKNIPPISLEHYMGKQPGHRPRTQAKMTYDDEAVYVIFPVEDRYVRARATEHQKGVSQDSCVEFFFSPGPEVSAGYFYLEMNCGGTMLFRFNGPNNAVVELKQEDYGTMKIAHSLPKTVDPEIQDALTWTLEYRLPLALLRKVCPVVSPGPGVAWRANFYKCADDSSHPHWLTWSPVENPDPYFHLPKFFGVLNFN